MAHLLDPYKETSATIGATLGRARPALLRRLSSLALIDRRHVTVALATADGRVVGVDPAARLGIVRAVARAVCDTFCDNVAEGDIILTNDPFSGGTHIQDMTLLRPLFVAEQLAGWALVQAPLPDLGGMALGGYYPFALEIWAEGIRVTPARLYRQGVLQRDALTMLTLNSRLPHLVERDVQSMVEILELANTTVADLATRQTPAVYAQALDQIIADTAVQAQATLSELPRGEWQGKSASIHCCLEEANLQVTVRLTVSGEAVKLDFSGSSPAAKGFVNTTTATAQAAAAIPFFSLWPALPVNDGMFQHLHIAIPDNTFLHAKLPMSVGWSPYQPSQAVVQAVAAALSQAHRTLPSAKQLAAPVTSPPLPFTVTGCGRPDCPFPIPQSPTPNPHEGE